MSSSQNGSDLLYQSKVFHIDDPSQIGEARRYASALCEELNFEEIRRARVGIIITELGTNLMKYAKAGRLILRGILQEKETSLEIISIDQGPGMDNSDLALIDGYSTGTSAGTGLGSVRRQADQFDIYSIPEKGTVIVAITYANENFPEESDRGYQISAISVPIKGETVCGDAWATREVGSQIFAIMADGLGHGPQAHTAASEAVLEFLDSTTQPQEELIQSIHQRLKHTRGAAVFLAATESDRDIVSCGAGNIRGLIQDAEKAKNLISQNGTAGLQMRSIKSVKVPWQDNSFLILHSDGISSRWDLSLYPGLMSRHPAIVAGVAYRDFNRSSDDSTILVIRKKK